jgi:hypothetical protein
VQIPWHIEEYFVDLPVLGIRRDADALTGSSKPEAFHILAHPPCPVITVAA